MWCADKQDVSMGAWQFSIWLLAKKMLITTVLSTLDGGQNAILSTAIQFVDMVLLLYSQPFVNRLAELTETLGAITNFLVIPPHHTKRRFIHVTKCMRQHCAGPH